MCQAIPGEDAVDGGNGRQRSDSLLVQDPGDGLSSIKEAPVIEMESFHYNNFFDFLMCKEVHRFLSCSCVTEFVVEDGVIEDVLLEEVFVYGINALDRGPDEGLDGQLIHDPGDTLCQVKDGLDGVIEEEFFGSFGTLQMVTDILTGVFYGKPPEVMGEDNTLPEGFILRFSDAQGESLGPGEDEREPVFGIHVKV
jgi:hypothetical protein